jgi:hypothetical protein
LVCVPDAPTYRGCMYNMTVDGHDGYGCILSSCCWSGSLLRTRCSRGQALHSTTERIPKGKQPVRCEQGQHDGHRLPKPDSAREGGPAQD